MAENWEIIAELPDKGDSNSPHFTSYVTPEQTLCLPNKLTDDGTRQAYSFEKQSWIDAEASDRVLRNHTSSLSNTIESHVVYRRKSDGTPKARIVSCSHQDFKKDNIRGEAPPLNLDSMHLLFFLAAKHRWTARKMNVKSAYLQAKRFCREVFVRHRKEKNDKTAL